MGRDWYEEVIRRPSGYAVTWRYTVVGAHAQAQFDQLVLTAASRKDVLDCGCGDGAFTVEVARVARRVVGVDFAGGMVEAAKRRAQASDLANLSFVEAHVRTPELFEQGTFDIAYSRRGPRLVPVVLDFVLTGGLLIGLHPFLSPPSPPCTKIDPVRYRTELETAGLDVRQYHVIEDEFHYPSEGDLIEALSREPGQPDLRDEANKNLRDQHIMEFASGRGDYVIRRTYLLFEAVKLFS